MMIVEVDIQKCEERRNLVRNAFEQDPQMSIRRAQNLLEIHSSLQRILRADLKKKAYHIQVCHSLTEEDYPVSYVRRAYWSNSRC